MIHSEDGKETLAIWQSLGRSSEYLEAVQQYPEGFSVFKIEDPSEYTVDENWEPVQE